MNRQRSRMLVAALALSLLVATSVTACTSSKDTGGEGGSGAGASKSSTPRATNDPAKNGANEMGVDKPDPSKVLFSKQFDIPGNSARKVTVGILSLQRKGRIAILKVVVTPQFADLPATETIDFTKALDLSGQFWVPTLLDLKNLQRYQVLYGGGRWLHYQDGEALSGQPIYGWAVFAAPPASVTNLDLTITEWIPRFTNVPIR